MPVLDIAIAGYVSAANKTGKDKDAESKRNGFPFDQQLAGIGEEHSVRKESNKTVPGRQYHYVSRHGIKWSKKITNQHCAASCRQTPHLRWYDSIIRNNSDGRKITEQC
jgi:hypothetical protein